MGSSSSKRSSPSDAKRSTGVVETRYGTSIKFAIPSDFARGREVQSRILHEIEKYKYNTDCVFAIKLSLEEAVVNAIKHGNKADPSKMVYVEALIGPQQCEISVEDEGPGFDRTNVPDPTAEENLEKCSGRGILLIESYMTSVRWSNHGKRLHMVKRND